LFKISTMKKILFLFLITPLFMAQAQEEVKMCRAYTAFTDPVTMKVIYYSAEIMPEFADPDLNFHSYFRENLILHHDDDIIQGIRFSFVVQPDGEITHKKVLNAPNTDIEQLILELLEKMPPVKPGSIKNAAVPVLMEFSIDEF
jgi:hypothetical protein